MNYGSLSYARNQLAYRRLGRQTNYFNAKFFTQNIIQLIGVGALIGAVWQIFTWDFTFLNGDYIFFRWLLITISVGLFVAFMLEIFRLVRGSG